MSCLANVLPQEPRRSVTSSVTQLGFRHPQVVNQFVKHSLPDLVLNLDVRMTDLFYILLIKNDAVWD